MSLFLILACHIVLFVTDEMSVPVLYLQDLCSEKLGRCCIIDMNGLSAYEQDQTLDGVVFIIITYEKVYSEQFIAAFLSKDSPPFFMVDIRYVRWHNDGQSFSSL